MPPHDERWPGDGFCFGILDSTRLPISLHTAPGRIANNFEAQVTESVFCFWSTSHSRSLSASRRTAYWSGTIRPRVDVWEGPNKILIFSYSEGHVVILLYFYYCVCPRPIVAIRYVMATLTLHVGRDGVSLRCDPASKR